MANRVSGEIHKKGGILQQTFGETVANAYGLVFYQAADGKLYRARAWDQAGRLKGTGCVLKQGTRGSTQATKPAHGQ